MKTNLEPAGGGDTATHSHGTRCRQEGVGVPGEAGRALQSRLAVPGPSFS